MTPWTEAHRKKVILCLANSVLKKAQDIKADQIKVRGVHSEDSTLVGVLKELGFTRTATNYDMEKNLRLPEESRS